MALILIQVPPGDCICSGGIVPGVYSFVCDRNGDGVIEIEVDEIVGASFAAAGFAVVAGYSSRGPRSAPSGDTGPRLVPPFTLPRFTAPFGDGVLGVVDPAAFERIVDALAPGEKLKVLDGAVDGLDGVRFKAFDPSADGAPVDVAKLPAYSGVVEYLGPDTFSGELGVDREIQRAALQTLDEMSSTALGHLGLLGLLASRPGHASGVRGARTADGLRGALARMRELRVAIEADDVSAGAVFARIADVAGSGAAWAQGTALDPERDPPFATNLATTTPLAAGTVFPASTPSPAELTPEMLRQIEHLISVIEEALERGIVKGDAATALRTQLARLRELLAGYRNGTIRARAVLVQLGRLSKQALKALQAARGVAGVAKRAGTLIAELGQIARVLGRLLGRLAVFLGPVFALLFAADAGWAMGSAIAEIEVGGGQTVGTWWGKRLWELMKGPIPDLLEAINIATYVLRLREQRDAPVEEIAAGLQELIVLEQRYADQLERGSEPWRQQMLHLRRLRLRLRELLDRVLEEPEIPEEERPPLPGDIADVA